MGRDRVRRSRIRRVKENWNGSLAAARGPYIVIADIDIRFSVILMKYICLRDLLTVFQISLNLVPILLQLGF